jgi:RHS repeat-associated protein
MHLSRWFRLLDHYQYGYDRDSNPTYKLNTLSTGNSELYTYDGLNQLSTFARGTLSDSNGDGVPDTIASPTHSQSWTPDALGNFQSVTTDGTGQSRTNNKQNQLTVAGASTLTYDNAGNLTADETGRTFTYDAWNRPVKVNGTTRYAYDALGRRIKEGSTDLYYSKDWQVVEERNSSNQPTARYVWSAVYVDALVLRDRDADGNSGNGLEERLYALNDANYNVTALVNTSRTVVERFLYDPFGRFDVKDASWGSRSGSSYDWVYVHQGGRWDATSGFCYFRNRDYSPTLMRWTSVDPVGLSSRDLDLYRYEGDDAITFVDPVGLERFHPREIHEWPTAEEVDATRRRWGEEKARGKADRNTPGIKICQRNLIESDSYNRCANKCGGQHMYIQFGGVDEAGHAIGTDENNYPPEASVIWGNNGQHTGPTVGVGWGGGPPNDEHAFRPSTCTQCNRTGTVLQNGSGAGRTGLNATDQEIWDCLKNHPPRLPYGTFSYNSLPCEGVTEVAEGVGRFRSALQRPAIRSHGLVQPSLRNQGVAEVIVGVGILRPQLQRSAVGGYRLIQTSLDLERVAQIVMSFGVIRFQSQRPLVGGHGFTRLAQSEQGVSQVVVRYGHVRPQSQRQLIMVDGLLQPAPSRRHAAKRAVDVRAIGSEQQGLFIARRGVFELSEGLVSQAEVGVIDGGDGRAGDRVAE